MRENKECMMCKSEATVSIDYDTDSVFYACPVCGRYQLTNIISGIPINYNHAASYLFYHRFMDSMNTVEYRYHTTMSKEKCDEYRKAFDDGNNLNGRPVHIDEDIIENWYPKTFAERVDNILVFLVEHTSHVGQSLTLTKEEVYSLLFVDRKEPDSENQNRMVWRKEGEQSSNAAFLLRYLKDKGYIKCSIGDSSSIIRVEPDGYARVDVIQKNASSGRNALVAMKFGVDTKALREAIRKGIIDAGYNAIFIDEVQHNDFITPELLKYIRESKFMVVDLTHKNNGAYFEEGYAMGLGKPVIQLCKNRVKLHFDIAQKNTIIWDTEDDISERLTNRIKATID